MQITELITIKTFTFHTVYLFIFLGFLLSLFICWFEGRGDGFDLERIFDLFFINLFVWIAMISLAAYFSRFYHRYSDVRYISFCVYSFLGLLLVSIVFASKFWHWSIYRLLDIFSFVVLISISLTLLGFGLIYQDLGQIYRAIGVGFYFIIAHNVRIRIPSGLTFALSALFLLSISPIRFHLIFYIFALTIVSLVLYKRYKLGFKFTLKTRKNMLDKTFLDSQKEKLMQKKKRLEEELIEIEQEDPYLQEGRDVGNAEAMDEALLEDRAKVELEVQKANILEMKKQIGKALKRMDNGEYGTCEITGEPIDKARLEAYPEATTTYEASRHDSAV
ncbi:TraR/DksA C4-type zinc finger protein [Patescibacteria group bacterium]